MELKQRTEKQYNESTKPKVGFFFYQNKFGTFFS